MVDAYRVFKARVSCPGVNQVYVTQLGDITKALEVFSVDYRQDGLRNVHVAPDGVPHGFAMVFEEFVFHWPSI